MNGVFVSNPSAIRNLSLVSLQGLNENIYGPTNHRSFGNLRRVARITRYTGRVQKAATKEKVGSVEYHLTMAFSWLLATANGLGFLLEDELWKRFPGNCFHCKQGPCRCGQEIPLFTPPTAVILTKPSSLKGFQDMFAAIYPNNTLQGEAVHLLQEVCELTEAVDNFTGTNQIQFLKDAIDESCDVAAHICGTATCMQGIDMAEQFEIHFGSGCFGCHETPCGCGFPSTRTVT
ncbi:MAG: hypothetical protein RLY66_319 [Candidatus Parcubacteria bacterium]